MNLKPAAPAVEILQMAERRIRMRYAGSCVVCATALDQGASAWWDGEARTVTCVACRAEPPPPPEPPSSGGASARRRYEQLHDRREREVRERHPRLGGLILGLTNDPQTTTAWARGAEGERRLGGLLDRLSGERIHVLHDRRIPGSRANIDHLVVAPSGVWVVDAKAYADQRVERRDVGGLFRRDLRLYVGGRDRTKLVAGMARQLDAVRGALADRETPAPLRPTLCFLDADFALLARPFEVNGVLVTWPRALTKSVQDDGPLGTGDVKDIAGRLVQLPPA